MKKSPLTYLLFVFLLTLVTMSLQAMPTDIGKVTPLAYQDVTEISTNDFLSLDYTEIVDKFDRKLTFREKASIKIVQRRLVKADPKDPDNLHKIRTDGFAITGLVLGILGVFTIIAAPLAIIFSAISLARIKRNPNQVLGRGMAIAGLVLGIVVTAVVTALLVSVTSILWFL